MWYKFQNGNSLGAPRVKQYQVAFYDGSKKHEYFDELFYSPAELDKVLPFVETQEDLSNNDKTRVFVHFNDGEIYELKLKKVKMEEGEW